jgi:hypothetical protein
MNVDVGVADGSIFLTKGLCNIEHRIIFSIKGENEQRIIVSIKGLVSVQSGDIPLLSNYPQMCFHMQVCCQYQQEVVEKDQLLCQYLLQVLDQYPMVDQEVPFHF